MRKLVRQTNSLKDKKKPTSTQTKMAIRIKVRKRTRNLADPYYIFRGLNHNVKYKLTSSSSSFNACCISLNEYNSDNTIDRSISIWLRLSWSRMDCVVWLIFNPRWLCTNFHSRWFDRRIRWDRIARLKRSKLPRRQRTERITLWIKMMQLREEKEVTTNESASDLVNWTWKLSLICDSLYGSHLICCLVNCWWRSDWWLAVFAHS